MNVHRLHGPPPLALAAALAALEERFTYPLGPGRTFRISHGDDYPRFFRAMGEGACFVAERGGQALGVLGVAVRRLLFPEGEERHVAYVGDLKVAPECRGGVVLARLVREALGWVAPKVRAAFSVVMDGTRATPEQYTGRAGVPAFARLGSVVVLRLPTGGPIVGEEGVSHADPTEAAGCYRGLSAGRYAAVAGDAAERSEMEPVWLTLAGGGACGLLEDTRRAKRLVADDGQEMRSAHLSAFAFRTPADGARLLRAALRIAAGLGHPALFVAVAAHEADAVREELLPVEGVAAPATVYGIGLGPGPAWNVNTSEV